MLLGMSKKMGGKKLGEAFIQLQIEVKRKEIQEFKAQIKELETKTQKLVKLREQLQEEQQGHVSLLRKQVKEQEKKLKEKEVYSKDQVEQAVQHNLDLTRIQEEELADLHRQLTGLQAQVGELQTQWQDWQLYKNAGSVEHLEQIQKLQSELDSMHNNFQAMSGNIERSLKASISEIGKNTSHLIEQEKQLALEKALKQIDDHSLQEIHNNDWLKKQIAIYHDEVSLLDAAVSKLEEENLEIIKQLFDYRLRNVQISSTTFLTQAGDSEQKLSLLGDLEQKLPFSAEIGREQHQPSGKLEGDERDHSCKPSSPRPPHLCALLYGSQSNHRESLHLDLLEQKLLSVVGQAMPLNPLPCDPEDLETLAHLGLIQAQHMTLKTNFSHKELQS